MYQPNEEKEQKIFIEGPVGRLEAMVSGLSLCSALTRPSGTLSRSRRGENQNVGIICHPHPLYQGSMNNKVVTTVARAWQSLGLASIRFNFRGVGESEGVYDNGVGEVADLEAVLTLVQKGLLEARIWLAGFSFGAFIALKAALQTRISGLISIAPALSFFDFAKVARPICPWLVIHGEEDELVSEEQVYAWYQALDKEKPINLHWELAMVPGASHFFHGRLMELKALIEQFMHKWLVEEPQG